MALKRVAQHLEVAIIGSGFGGLGTAIKLKQAGIDNFLIFERANDLGGTWRDNTYPGCACDVQSHLYSFSFAPNANWSRMFSPQPEIWAYLKRCANDFGLMPYMRFNHNVNKAVWNNEAQYWQIETSQGDYTATSIVAGVGALSEPSIPKLPGIESFQGKAFHSAQWDHNYDLTGRKVAVVGTGASAIQFVPEIQPKVGQLNIFQRTPPWIVPRQDRAVSQFEKNLFNKFPFVLFMVRTGIYWFREIFLILFRKPHWMRYFQHIAISHMKRAVADPELRAKLTPKYTIGCKRILISNNYLPALTKPNVSVITEKIKEVRAHSIVTEDGTEREIDTIIYGTGFKVSDLPFSKNVYGIEGRSMAEIWQGSPKAHLGTTVTGFPNLFLLLGPNTGLGHNSVVFMIESQISHVMNIMRYMREHNIAVMEPRPEVQTAFIDDVEQRMKGTVWTSGGCKSWYLDSTGRNSTLWPGYSWQFYRRVAGLNANEYRMVTRSQSRSVNKLPGMDTSLNAGISHS